MRFHLKADAYFNAENLDDASQKLEYYFRHCMDTDYEDCGGDIMLGGSSIELNPATNQEEESDV